MFFHTNINRQSLYSFSALLINQLLSDFLHFLFTINEFFDLAWPFIKLFGHHLYASICYLKLFKQSNFQEI